METNQEKTVVNEQKPEKRNSVLSVISFLFGLASIILFYFAAVSIPCAIVAIIFSTIDKKISMSTLSVAGLVMGIINLALYVIVLATCLIIDNSFGGIEPLIEMLL